MHSWEDFKAISDKEYVLNDTRNYCLATWHKECFTKTKRRKIRSIYLVKASMLFLKRGLEALNKNFT